MKLLHPVVVALVVVGLIVKFFWWTIGVGAIAVLGYVIYHQAEKPSPTKVPVSSPVTPRAKSAQALQQPRAIDIAVREARFNRVVVGKDLSVAVRDAQREGPTEQTRLLTATASLMLAE